jgi:hypothetical protein
MTVKQTTKQHALVGNRFIISKYTQPLLSNAFANEHVPTATNPHATVEELLKMVFSA